MSRTYRRKKSSPEWVTHEFVSVYEGTTRRRPWEGYRRYGASMAKRTHDIYTYYYKPRIGKDLRKHLKKYRSDSDRGYYSPPSDFVNCYANKPYRAKMKQEVIKITKLADDYLDYNFNPNKKTARWLWW